MAKAGLKILKGPTDADLQRMFSGVPTLERFRVGDQVVRAGAKPITNRFRQLVPRSKASDTDKRSKDQKKKADWNAPLWKTVKVVVRKGNSSNRGGAIAVIGPEFVTAASKIYLIAEHTTNTRRVVLWGRKQPDATKQRVRWQTAGQLVNRLRNLAVQAFDETNSQQASAMKAKLKNVMDNIYRG